MPHPFILDLIEGIKKAQLLPNGELHCGTCGHRGFDHQHLGDRLGACTKCSCPAYEQHASKVRESAAEVMDGELRIGQVSQNLAAGPTLSEVLAEDEDPRE